MPGKKIKNLVVVVLVVSVFSLQTPKAEAGLPVMDIPHTTLTSIFSAFNTAGIALTNASVGFAGTGSATKAAQEGAKTGCKVLRASVEAADAADMASGAAAAVVGEGYIKVTKLTARLTQLKALKLCYQTVLNAISYTSVGTGSVGGLQSINTTGFNEAQLTANVESLEQQILEIKKQKTDAMEQVWKAISIRMLMRAQQTITTNLVRSMTKKYKISNYQDYAGALASQVYAVDYINKNIPDNRDQMIVKSMMKNGTMQNTAWPMIQSKAEDNLGFDPLKIDITSDNYYEDLTKVGAGNTNPYVLKIIADDKAQQAMAQSQMDAKTEISSSEGMISLRTCNDVSRTELDKDRQLAGLQQQFALDEAVYKKVVSQQIVDPKSVTPAELTKAATKLAQSRTALSNFVKGNKAFEKPCQAIDNPGGFLAKSTNSILAGHLGSAANLKETNLPFFAGFLESTASNFLTNIIFQSSPGSQNLTDRGLAVPDIKPVEVAVGVTETRDLKQEFDASQTQNIFLSGDKTSSSANEYNLSWDAGDYLTGANAEGSYVIITGPLGLNRQFNDLKGSMLVGNPAGGTYTLKVYAKGQLAVTKTWVMPPLPNIQYRAPVEGDAQDAIDAADSLKGYVDLPPLPTEPAESTSTTTIIIGPGVLGVMHYAGPVLIRGPMSEISLRSK